MLGSTKGLEDKISALTAEVGKLISLQRETNEALKKLSHQNTEFLSTLISFMSHEDQRRMRREVKEAEDALGKTPTKYDAIY